MNSYMIIDGQFGSTGKGLLAGYLSVNKKPDAVICAFGPNAGHTCVVDGDYATLRTFPIRVGHEYQHGVKVGDSGPVYPDQVELEWGKGVLEGIEAEKTTVTGKVRRVFSFSFQGLDRMNRFVKPDHIFLNFGNYMSTDELERLIVAINHFVGRNIVNYIGTGPSIYDVVNLSN